MHPAAHTLTCTLTPSQSTAVHNSSLAKGQQCSCATGGPGPQRAPGICIAPVTRDTEAVSRCPQGPPGGHAKGGRADGPQGRPLTFLKVSATMGTVEFTGLEMTRILAFAQCWAHACARPFTMPAFVANRSSRVMPGFLGTP